MSELLWIAITKSNEHIQVLFKLLQDRQHTISHTHLPTYDQHAGFVANHPYRAWYLLSLESVYVGSVYIKTDNSIGFNIQEQYYDYIPSTLQYIHKHFKPLPPIKSERSSHFHVHVGPNNIKLQTILEKIGARHIQNTYAILNQS